MQPLEKGMTPAENSQVVFCPYKIALRRRRRFFFIYIYQHGVCRAQDLCESRGGRPGLPVPNSPYGLCGRKAQPDSGAKYGYDTVMIDNK